MQAKSTAKELTCIIAAVQSLKIESKGAKRASGENVSIEYY
jgi:hypothetical protein